MPPPRERLRKHKFTDAELDILVKEVTRHEHILFGLQVSRLTAREKYKIWFGITEQVCAASGLQRSIEDVKRRWQDLRRRTKAKVLDARRQMSHDRPTPSLSSVERRVFDSLGVHPVVKEEEQNATTSQLSEDLFLDAGTAPVEICQQSVEQQQSPVTNPHGEESSVPSVAMEPDTEQSNAVLASRPEIMVKNEVYHRYPFSARLEAVDQEESPNLASVMGPYTEVIPRQRVANAAFARRSASLSPFEQQLLRAHREHTAALREGFRSLSRQNRLLYRELCETNKNVARVASRIAEKSESVTDVAEELMGIHHKISESIEATNCLQDRVLDLLATQQERPLLVLPSSRHDGRPASSAVEDESKGAT